MTTINATPPTRAASGPRAKTVTDNLSISRISRYHDALASTPPAGAGLRHSHAFHVARLAKLAGISLDQAAHDWAAACPGRGRAVAEMAEAYRNVRCDGTVATLPTRPYQTLTRPEKIDPGPFWKAALERHPDPIAELWETSPFRLLNDAEADTVLFLREMYDAADVVFIGGTYDDGIPGRTLRTADNWIGAVKAGHHPAMFVCANPLTGGMAQTKDGKPSRRCDAAVAAYRYAVIEFDGLPKTEQAAFFLHARLPLAAVVDSGGKSLHGWVHVDTDCEDWNRDVRPVFTRLLGPLGADRALSNASRLVRCPGALRDNGNRQSLLYLAGRAAA